MNVTGRRCWPSVRIKQDQHITGGVAERKTWREKQAERMRSVDAPVTDGGAVEVSANGAELSEALCEYRGEPLKIGIGKLDDL